MACDSAPDLQGLFKYTLQPMPIFLTPEWHTVTSIGCFRIPLWEVFSLANSAPYALSNIIVHLRYLSTESPIRAHFIQRQPFLTMEHCAVDCTTGSNIPSLCQDSRSLLPSLLRRFHTHVFIYIAWHGVLKLLALCFRVGYHIPFTTPSRLSCTRSGATEVLRTIFFRKFEGGPLVRQRLISWQYSRYGIVQN